MNANLIFKGMQLVTAEDFEIESLAKFLHLSPEQVRKMANRGKLPARKVGGEWKFSRAEIHHWLEDRIGSSDESGLVEVEHVLHKLLPDECTDISYLLTVERIAIPLAARTKNSVIDCICEFSANSGALWLPKEMSHAVRQREELHPTALESGVALLHPRRPKPNYFGESFLALGITSNGIPFGGPRGCLTDVFFLIAASNESLHLKILARLSRLIQVNGLLDNIRAADDPSVVWQLLSDAEDLI